MRQKPKSRLRYDSTFSENRTRDIRPFKAVTVAGYFIQHSCWRVRPDLSNGGSLERGDVYELKINPRIFSVVMDDKRLSPGAFKAWHVLYSMTGKNTHCWPSIATLSERLNANPKSAQRWINELVSCGYLRVERGDQKRSNKYFINPAMVKMGTGAMGNNPIPMAKSGASPMVKKPKEFNSENSSQEENSPPRAQDWIKKLREAAG